MNHFIRRHFSTLLTCIHTIRVGWKRNIKIGNGSKVYFKSAVLNYSKGEIIIGKKCLIGRTSICYHAGMPFFTTILNDGENSSIKIGDNCRLNGVYVHSKSSISIGNNCVMASGVNIIDSNAHQITSLDRTVGKDEPSAITIGNNVWIGLNAIILKGTMIGDNSIVAAGAVVKGVYPSNCIIKNPSVVVENRDYNYK